MQNFLTDVRYVLRTLRKQPGFALVAILTLALGIGANTAVFSVLDSVILAPLPYDEPEDLVRLYTGYRQNPGQIGYTTSPDIVEVRDQVDAFSSIGIMYTYREVGLDLTTDGPPRRIRALRISAEYFQTYRATPLLGRVFTRDEERRDVQRVVLSHHLWDAYAGRDPDIVGKSLQLNDVAFEVIGVMRPSFMDVVAGDVDAWIPQNLEMGSSGNGRNNHYLTAVARLSAGVSVDQAQAQVTAVMSRLETEYPRSNEDRIMQVTSLHADVVGESSAAVYVLMGAAGLVLLIACLNVANLFLARSVAQTKETAIRTALGAARSRVMGQRFTESILVAAAGGLVGSIVAYWGVKVLLAVSPASLARAEELGISTGLLGFAIAITVLTGLAFGAAPAFRASRVDPNEALHEGSRGNTGGRASHRARNVLVATQVSVALVLLVGAGILIKSFVALQGVDLGFDPRNLATFEVHLPSIRYDDPEQRVEFHHQFQDRLNALPGVRSVAATSWLPANGHYHQWGYGHTDDAGEYQWIPAMIRVVEGEYFDALDIPLVSGRTFTRLDRLDTAPVAIVSESLARLVHGDSDPLGQTFSLNGDEHTIIGVVGNVAYEANGMSFDKVYVSHGQFAGDRNWGLTYTVKAEMVPGRLVEPARRALAAIDPALVLYHPRSMEAVIGRHRARDQFTLLLMVVFAAVALTLAAVGVYGVLSYTVSQRTHEIGVRMALGARPGQVRATVMVHGATVAGIGMLVGLIGAFGLSRLLESLVFEVSSRDPTVFFGVAIVLALVVLAAGYVPARRATRVDPLDALRSE
ncbi:MAG: ABC transporter permease [Gemmatimonadales bacterium]